MRLERDMSSTLKRTLSVLSLLVATFSVSADPTLWSQNPMNYANNPLNYQNSPLNYNNSPMNWENNPMNLNSHRIIRDNSGRAMGYAVPKPDGGVNYYDVDGDREGYEDPLE